MWNSYSKLWSKCSTSTESGYFHQEEKRNEMYEILLHFIAFDAAVFAAQCKIQGPGCPQKMKNPGPERPQWLIWSLKLPIRT